MRLRDDVAGEPASPVIVVALAAREIELALAPLPGRAPGFEERPDALVDRDLDGQAARLARQVGGHCEQFAALVGKRWCLLSDAARRRYTARA